MLKITFIKVNHKAEMSATILEVLDNVTRVDKEYQYTS